jgi:hypothetical protein
MLKRKRKNHIYKLGIPDISKILLSYRLARYNKPLAEGTGFSVKDIGILLMEELRLCVVYIRAWIIHVLNLFGLLR